MSFISDSTDNINGKIATLKTVSNKSKAFSKYKQVSKKANGLMESIMEIYNQLCGYDDMIKSIETLLSGQLENIEEVIKSAIKIALKKIISCGIEPTIGDELIITGVTFDIKKIDPLSIFGIDPNSENGKYIYFDNNSGINSTDFNVFLYAIIKESIDNENYNGAEWYKIKQENSKKIKTPLFRATFKESLNGKSNLLTIKINENFRGKKLSFFISEYLDTIKLFNNVQILSAIFDDLLSSNIISINKTTDQIAAEKNIKELVDKLINNIEDEEDFIDDSFYSFSNDTYNEILVESENKRNGVFTYNGDKTNINQELLLNSLNQLNTEGLFISEQTKIITDTIDAVTNDLINTGKLDGKYILNFKFDIIKKIITKFTTTISTFIFTPKIIFLFSMTSKLYGLNDANDVKEFIKNNINIYKIVIVKIRDLVVKFLIEKIKEKLSPLIKNVSIELIKEKYAIYKKQIETIKDSIENAIDTVNDFSSDINNKVENIT